MAAEIAIKLANVSKFYKLYDASKDRLKEVLHPLGKKYHRNHYVLRNLDLEIFQGEILGIVGRNGSGKSTLLKIITGVLYPNEGGVTVNGRISALLELGTGFNPEFTGIENICFYGVVNGFGKEFMQAKVDEIVAFADIGEYINQPLKNYSSGMKTRLGFAVAIHVTPDILILDEVLAVGDELFRRKCYAKMEEFFTRGTTILYVSHDIHSIIQLCTRAIFLDDGAILASGAPKTVAELYQKVLYASPENRTRLIQDLLDSRAHTQSPAESADVIDLQDGQSSLPEIVAQPSAANDSNDLASAPLFLEEFRSQSVVEYRNEAIDIMDSKIQTLAGKTVNVLLFGERYVYSVKYHSRAEKAFSRVTLGFEIKNSKGTVLSSIDATRALKQNVAIQRFEPGAVVELKVEFDCRLPAGTYFTNNGLSTFESGEQTVLNRKVDILCFKVLDAPTRVFGGLFACMQSVSIKTSEGILIHAVD